MSSRQPWSALEERRHNDDDVLSGPAVLAKFTFLTFASSGCHFFCFDLACSMGWIGWSVNYPG
jgi:hypothetical protein